MKYEIEGIIKVIEKMNKVEKLAKLLHEAGREAVEKNALLNKNEHGKFIEWDELPENARYGRMLQATYLLEHKDLLMEILNNEDSGT